jgi:hypothetical protein
MHDLDRLVTAAATLDPDDHASAVRLREQAHRSGTPLSRHVTSEGVVTYARDTDGRLVVQLDRWPPTTTLRRTVEGTRADTGSARRTCA